MDSSQNNPFGSFSSGGAGPSGFSAPVSSGAGDDIILSGAAQKRSNKKLIIGIVVGVVLLIGAVVGFLMMRRNNVSTAVNESFYRYANYIMYGEDLDSALEGEYDDSNIYMIDKVGGTNSNITSAEFFRKSDELLSNFEESIRNKSEELINYVNEYRGNFELIKSINNKKNITDDDLVLKVLNNNLDEVKKWVIEEYSDLMKMNYDVIRRYAQAEIGYYQSFAEYLESLKSKGCFEEEANQCEGDVDESLNQKMMEYNEEASGIERDARQNLLKGCWKIDEMINGGSEQ